MNTTTQITRETLTAGSTIFTVTPDAAWLRVRELMGDTFHADYTYQITRKDGVLFLVTWTDNGKSKGRFVYTGVVTPKGEVKMTAKSAFPAHATRVRIANRVLQCVFAGEMAKVDAAGWSVEVVDAAELVAPF